MAYGQNAPSCDPLIAFIQPYRKSIRCLIHVIGVSILLPQIQRHLFKNTELFTNE